MQLVERDLVELLVAKGVLALAKDVIDLLEVLTLAKEVLAKQVVFLCLWVLILFVHIVVLCMWVLILLWPLMARDFVKNRKSLKRDCRREERTSVFFVFFLSRI
jgi:hypothetical protein